MGVRPLPRTAIGLPRPAGSLARSIAEPPLRAVEWLLGLSGIEAAAKRVERGLETNGALGEVMLESTGVRAVVDARELAQIPARGGAVLCSNHPFGGADAITLIALALRRRADVKVLANGMLRRLPFMSEHCIFVDPFGGADAARANAAALRDALGWLRDGHLLIVFPAGEVSAIAWGRWTPADPPWSVIPFRLAQKTGARVVPAWCDGCNRTIFHAAGLLHPRLRTALLPGEFVARFGREVHYRIGAPFDSTDGGLAPEELARLARGRCELLRGEARPPSPAVPSVHIAIAPSRSSGAELRAELEALGPSGVLAREGSFTVYTGRASALPRTMHELGRLREEAFRAVGEGSGKALDLDRFDDHYHQLVLWNDARGEIAGGYRAGVVAEVARDERGDIDLGRLYTSTLFEYSPRLVEQLGDAVELGRSFVRPSYQRQPLPLSLLWRAIAVFMARGGHRRLFGPVSISNEYTSMSKELIMEFLERHRLSVPFAPLVKPRHPPERSAVAGWTGRERGAATADMARLDRLVEEIERGERAVPVLLRQYLRLNAQLLAFNVDPDFGDVVDALMLVDIGQIDPRILRYYLGDAAPA
ncbi:MAG: hypothetical protein RI967_2133 [Planctomycetota bacterium]|jgi:putative hemolysin